MAEAPQNIPCPTDPGELFSAGNAAAQSKDYLKAMKFYLLAARDHVGAQNQIGLFYMCGLGVKQDYSEAVKWFRTAADQGFAPAQDHLGLMYKAGSGVNRDAAEAMKWFRKAAHQQFSAAQYNIGLLYHYGIGVEPDLPEAAKWYRNAADQGLALAQNSLGMCFLRGAGVKTDFAQAVAWFRKAADQSLAIAEHNLGSMFQHGWGLKQDYAEALRWNLKAAVQGSLEAQNDAGWFHVMGWGVQQDYHTAMNWFRKAAENGYPPAQFNIGFLYERGFGVDRNLAEAITWYRRAAGQGFSPARQKWQALIEAVRGHAPAATTIPPSPQVHEIIAEQVSPDPSTWLGKTAASYRKILVRDSPEAEQTRRVLMPGVNSGAPGPAISPGKFDKDALVTEQVAAELLAWNRKNFAGGIPLTVSIDPALNDFDGSYHIESVLAGGMGVVFIGRVTGDQGVKYHAMKTLRPELLAHPDVVKRFEYEAYVWISLLPHPNVVRAKTYFNGEGVRSKGSPSLMLEYVDGGNLRSRLRRGALAEDELLRISMEFCDGMEFLFLSARIVHRDIKPENILFTRAGDVKITDFGLAKALLSLPREESNGMIEDTVDSDGNLTRHGAILGTLPYMSPEQYVSPQEVTVASDVYSFGVVLYEMATGRLPFAATSFTDWRHKHQHERAASPSSFAPVSEALSFIVMKCLEKSAAQRFRDFAELLAAMESYCHSIRRSSLIPVPVSVSDLETKMTAGDWFLQGRAFEQIGDENKSVESYVHALKLNPGFPSLNSALGGVLLRLGRHEEAVQHYRKEVESYPNSPHSHVLLGEAYISVGQNEDGLAAMSKATQLDPGNIAIWRRYAFAARSIGSIEQYKHAVARVIELQKFASYDNAETVMNAAIFFAQVGRIDLAVNHHIFSVKKFPENARCWYNFAVTVHRREKFEEALKFYNCATERDRRLTLAYVNRGFVHAVQGDRKQAEQDWRSAIAIHTAHPACKLVESLCRIESGPEFTKALADCHLDGPGTTINYLQIEDTEESSTVTHSPDVSTAEGTTLS
jgi:TPR repeat protein/serine/threonine protein kinase